MNKKAKKSIAGFTLIELSIVLLIIAFVSSSVIATSKMIELSRLSRARHLTNNATFVNKKSLVLWLEPTLKDSFDENVSDGNVVDEWNNLSDKDMNPLATSGNEPMYVRKGIGNLPTLRFDGTNDYLQFDDDSIAAMNPEEFTIFIVCSVAGGEDVWRSPFTSRSNINPGGSGYMFYASNVNNWAFLVGNGFSYSRVNHSDVTLNSPIILSGMRDSTTISIYVNNVNPVSSSPNFERNSVYPARIGAGVTENATPNWYWNGDISEIIIFNEALGDAERDEIYDYLADKYNLD